MGKLFITAICIGLLTFAVAAQEVDFTISVTEPTGMSRTDGGISVQNITVKPGYTCYLYDKQPWKGGRLIEKKENVSVSFVTFENLGAGNYFVLIEDKEKIKPEGMTVKLDPAQ